MALPRVCACAIVRNEERTFPRLAASLAGIVDYWAVVDTGSTDSTRELVPTSFGDIPGELHERPWVDFGHNRSELMELARGKAEWLLLVDADMIVSGDLTGVSLGGADAYLLEHSGSQSYWIPRLLRGDLPWRFVGVTHEYLALERNAPHSRAKLAALTIDHFADGGSRSDKYDRDRRLLEAEVEKRPEDARSWFYLGRTYLDMGLLDLAVTAFRRRVTLGGWQEEAYYAGFEAGNALSRAGREEEAICAWLEAWQLRPSRLEALHAAIRSMRAKGWYQAAFALAESVVGAQPPDDILFVHRDVWEFELPLEHSICAYYVQGPRACLTESERLLNKPGLPKHVRKFAFDNAALCRRDLGLVRV